MRPSDDIFTVSYRPGRESGGATDTLREAFEQTLAASSGVFPKGSQAAANRVEAALRERYPHLRIKVKASSDGGLKWVVDEDMRRR